MFQLANHLKIRIEIFLFLLEEIIQYKNIDLPMAILLRYHKFHNLSEVFGIQFFEICLIAVLKYEEDHG